MWLFQVRRQALDFPHIERLFLTSEHIYWLSSKNERAVPSPMTREHIYVGTRDNFNEPQLSWYISSRVNLYRTLDKLRIKIHGLNCFRCGLTKWWIKILWWMSIFFSKLMDNQLTFQINRWRRIKKIELQITLQVCSLPSRSLYYAPRRVHVWWGSSACVIQVFLHNLI